MLLTINKLELKNTSHRISGLDQRESVFKLRENGGYLSAGRSRVAVTRPARPEGKYKMERIMMTIPNEL